MFITSNLNYVSYTFLLFLNVDMLKYIHIKTNYSLSYVLIILLEIYKSSKILIKLRIVSLIYNNLNYKSIPN